MPTPQVAALFQIDYPMKPRALGPITFTVKLVRRTSAKRVNQLAAQPVRVQSVLVAHAAHSEKGRVLRNVSYHVKYIVACQFGVGASALATSSSFALDLCQASIVDLAPIDDMIL
jgi:hypothetical protein